jgi:hypothetical protein
MGFHNVVFVPGTELLLCSFTDGSVGVFNMVTRQMKYQGLPGHSETIFDVKFRPDSADILATASFDAAIKVYVRPLVDGSTCRPVPPPLHHALTYLSGCLCRCSIGPLPLC